MTTGSILICSLFFGMVLTKDKQNIQNFWGLLYDSLYGDNDQDISREQLLDAIDAMEDMFRYREHMAVVEMPLGKIKGKKILEIGPGAGGHSALFARYGASMTSLDLTIERAQATAKKFKILKANDCIAMQGDGENLPFDKETFDIVYSNGVLHHTNETEVAIKEVYRVLKPGGRAIIMLYCKSSWHYWINMWLFVGILKGALLNGINWLGPATEWGGKNKQILVNPITRCYTKRDINSIFSRFEKLSLRKGEFYFYLIPKLGRLYRRWQIKHYGVHPGGYLVYGEPWPIQSTLERYLGRKIGFAWFISAKKPEQNI